jgi:hypothetical protein
MLPHVGMSRHTAEGKAFCFCPFAPPEWKGRENLGIPDSKAGNEIPRISAPACVRLKRRSPTSFTLPSGGLGVGGRSPFPRHPTQSTGGQQFSEFARPDGQYQRMNLIRATAVEALSKSRHAKTGPRLVALPLDEEGLHLVVLQDLHGRLTQTSNSFKLAATPTSS